LSELKSKDISIEDMWQVIEAFGIDRVKLERTKPSDEAIKNIYRAIKNE
jgi:hypothetical protein